MLRPFAIALLSFVLATQQVEAAQPKAVIHFALRGGLPTFEALLDGKPATLIVDLGAFSPIALTPEAAKRLGVTYSEASARYRDATGQVFTSRGFSVSDVLVQGNSLGTVAGFEVLDNELTSRGLAGYVGVGFLQNYLLVFDYPAGTLSLFSSGDTKAMADSCGPQHFSIRFANGVVQSTIETDRGPLIFSWDTGSTENALRPSAIGLSATDAPVQAMQSFSKFLVGEVDVGRTVVPLREFRAPNVDGVLGTAFLESRVLCIDIKGRTAALK